MSKVICVDFDGVIHDQSNVANGYKMGKPVLNVQSALSELMKMGYKIVVLTANKEHQYIRNWLDYFGISYDEVTNIKPNAEFYIDDKAIRFTNWNKTIEEIKERI